MKEKLIGQIVKGVVSGVENYGIFVKIDNELNGLIHISEISNGYVRNVNDYATTGDTIYVEVLDYNEINNQVKLSIKNISYRIGVKNEKKIIAETALGFTTLEKNLPHWIEKNIKNSKKKINSIDK